MSISIKDSVFTTMPEKQQQKKNKRTKKPALLTFKLNQVLGLNLTYLTGASQSKLQKILQCCYHHLLNTLRFYLRAFIVSTISWWYITDCKLWFEPLLKWLLFSLPVQRCQTHWAIIAPNIWNSLLNSAGLNKGLTKKNDKYGK